MTVFRLVAALAGLAVVGWLAREIGPAALADELRRLSWRLGVLVLVQAPVSVLDAAGWGCAFPGRRPRLAVLTAARLAGEAVNDTTPTGTLGGEPVKAWLAGRAGIPAAEALASAVVAKTAFVTAQLLFAGLGLALALTWLAPPPALVSGMTIVLAVGLVAVGGFVWAQARGLFLGSGRLLAWLGLPVPVDLRPLDGHLRRFYRERPGAFALSVGFHLLGRLPGALEVWLGLRFLGRPVDLRTATVIEAFATAMRSAGFLVPAAVGVQESALVTIGLGFGLPASTGLAFGLVRRIREACWIALGYGVLAAWRTSPAAGGRASRSGATR